jgi:Xaa-Pro aminopeptidase
MKTDLDTLMNSQNLDALLVTGSGQHNPAMVYLTGGGHMTAELIKKRGADPVLFCNPMERDEAARTGLPTRNLGDYRMQELLKAAEGNYPLALAQRYQRMLADVGVTKGRVALYGRAEAGASFAVFSALQALMPEVTLVGETNDSLLLKARFTKGEQEAARIRHMGKVTTQVVAEVADFLTSHPARNGVLVKNDGQPLTIGEVKLKIDLWLAERGAENPEGTIFAIGRDSGVPHSSGNPDDLLRLGQSIVFDIYPCEKGGGYFYDFTRTWSLGYAPDELAALYETVKDVYNQVRTHFSVGEHCPVYQRLACDLFEAKGHPTIQNTPNTEQGYVHSLGHGLGLQVHERPWFGSNAANEDRIVPGVVFTVEPGLYYPERGMGVRLEDSVYVHPDGEIETLADFPMELVLPVRQA